MYTVAEDRGEQKSKIAQLLARAIQQAKSLGDSRSLAYALTYLGKEYENTQQWAEAFKLTEQALLIAQSISASDIIYQASWQEGRILKAKGDIQGTIAAYDSAVKTLKSLRSDLVAINRDIWLRNIALLYHQVCNSCSRKHLKVNN